MISGCRAIARLLTKLAVFTLPFWTALSTHAQVGGISYTLTPLAERVRFDDNAGFSDGTFVGARLGFGFGEYVELSGLYLVSTDLRTDFSRFAAFDAPVADRFDILPPRDVQARRYGAELKFNLGRSALLPYVSAGTGILQIDPEILDDSRLIYLTGAAGLQVGLGERFALLAQLQSLMYRYNPSNVLLSEEDLDDLGLRPTDFNPLNVHNFAVTAGIQMYVGGRSRGELTEIDRVLRDQFTSGISGVRLQIEPLGGVVSVDQSLGIRQGQRLAGAMAGLDLGPYLGLRTFYWRGIESGALTDFDALQAYGGEIHLRFGSLVDRLQPHIVVGGGYLDVMDGYDGNGFARAVDRPFVSGGGGISLPLARGIRLHGGVRILAMSTDDPADVSESSQLATSAFYSGGISFGLGGGRQSAPSRIDRDSSGDTERILSRTLIDSLQAVLRAGSTPGADAVVLPEIDQSGARWIMIPLPTEGELYVRYGKPSDAAPAALYVDPDSGALVRTPAPSDGALQKSLTAGEIETIVRDALRRELTKRPEDVLPDSSPSERRLRERIEELERRLAEHEPQGIPEAAQPSGYQLQALMPFAGFGLSSDQIVLAGMRADLRTPSLRGARFLPEIAAAMGADGVSYALNVNSAFPLGIGIVSLRPYAGLGLGIVTTDGAELVFNLLGGVELADGRFFAEYMSQDFFQLNRFVFGYKYSF